MHSTDLALADERTLLIQYHQHGDMKAREALVERFMPLARSLARRYSRSGESQDDLVQVATLGLINAIDRFSVERETAFSSFAVPTILGELKRYFRDRTWSVRVPRELQEIVLRLEPVTEEMAAKLGHPPTEAQLAAQLEVSVDQLREAQSASGAYRAGSLDQPLASEHGEQPTSYAERLGGIDPAFAQTERHVLLQTFLDELNDKEREVLELRFYHDMSQSEIAEKVNCSQMHVSRMIRHALSRLATLARNSQLANDD